MNLRDLSETQKALISSADRVKLGLEPTQEPLAPKPSTRARQRANRLERQDQNLLADWLRLHSISFDQDRMDKARTGPPGWPDFTIIHANRCLLGELKRPGARLSPHQQKVHAELAHNLTQVQTWTSFEQARAAIIHWFYDTHKISLCP